MTSPTVDVLQAAVALAQSIQASAEWHELIEAQKAAENDAQFARLVARHNELARIQNRARSGGQGLDGKSLVELLTLQDQLGRHELYLRQQQAGSRLVELLQRVNGIISRALGFDFASNASPPRGGGCG